MKYFADNGGIVLRLVQPSDYEFIQALETTGERLTTYRHRGTTPSPDEFVSRLWSGVIAQFVVCLSDTMEPIGLVAAYGADHRNQRVALSVVSAGSGVGAGSLIVRGMEVFIDYLFNEFNFRKITGYVLESNMPAWQSALGSVMRLEGQLRRHEFVSGGWSDVFMVALFEDDWRDRRATTFVVEVEQLRSDSVENFREDLANYLDRPDLLSVSPETELVYDGVLSSIEFMQMICALEESAGPLRDVDLLDGIVTLQDAYQLVSEVS